MKVKTAELSGRALDWAVAIAEGWQPDRPQDGQLTRNSRYIVVGDKTVDQRYWYNPSTDWSQCGPLTRDLLVMTRANNGAWLASCPIKSFDDENAHQWGDTLQIAICRAVVASKLGDEVDIPDELMESK